MDTDLWYDDDSIDLRDDDGAYLWDDGELGPEG